MSSSRMFRCQRTKGKTRAAYYHLLLTITMWAGAYVHVLSFANCPEKARHRHTDGLPGLSQDNSTQVTADLAH
jgi:hypothetical protein